MKPWMYWWMCLVPAFWAVVGFWIGCWSERRVLRRDTYVGTDSQGEAVLREKAK